MQFKKLIGWEISVEKVYYTSARDSFIVIPPVMQNEDEVYFGCFALLFFFCKEGAFLPQVGYCLQWCLSVLWSLSPSLLTFPQPGLLYKMNGVEVNCI